MIYSMTAYARVESQSDLGSLTCEMRSVNHRYLEISVHMPESLRMLEMTIREKIRNEIKRGKVECVIRYQPSMTADKEPFTINLKLAQALCKASESIASFLPQAASVYPTDILRFHGVLEMKEMDLSALQPQVMLLIDETLRELKKARHREGDELKRLLLQRTNKISEQLIHVRARLPMILNEQQERLKKRFIDAAIELEPQRLEQEMVMFAQKIDVAEEIERAETHVKEITRVLEQGGMIGRRLDFLLQELNREANTLGSKSVDSTLTHAAVELKVLTEQIREQIQNIE